MYISMLDQDQTQVACMSTIKASLYHNLTRQFKYKFVYDSSSKTTYRYALCPHPLHPVHTSPSYPRSALEFPFQFSMKSLSLHGYAQSWMAVYLGHQM